MAAEPQLLTTRDAAKLLQVHADTLLRWEREGRIQSVRPGGPTGWRKWRRTDVLALVDAA